MGLTRSAGVKTGGGGAARAWGGVAFTNTSAFSAVGSNVFATFSIGASNGYKVSFTSISRFDYYRSGTGPTNITFQFQIGTGAFTDITNFSYNTATSGQATGPAIDLSGFSALQNVGANTNVTFRVVNYTGGSVGTWYIYDTASNTAPDLAVQGTVTQVLATNAPAAVPVISQGVYVNNQFQLSVTGTAGSNYVVQAATNLTSPTWIPIWTNGAPFVFIESNLNFFPLRFYRVTAP